MSDGEVLCTDCAKSEFPAIARATISRSCDGWRCEGVQIHWEGAPEYCAHCNAQIESAYGDPEAAEARAEQERLTARLAELERKIEGR